MRRREGECEGLKDIRNSQEHDEKKSETKGVRQNESKKRMKDKVKGSVSPSGFRMMDNEGYMTHTRRKDNRGKKMQGIRYRGEDRTDAEG